MKSRRDDEDSSAPRQSLDGEVEGPSTIDGDNDEELKLEPKHKIFLSHSGFQKDFTEQLCVDLERCHYYPFFDKRDRSLPKGKKFPELIFQAAQQCEVAVLILSEDFFTRTKWPMLELEAFMEAQKKDPKKISILPVYLGISRKECTKNATKRLEWIALWREWAKSGERIDVEKWVEALKVLGPSNGIDYVQSLGEVMLRQHIVSAIWGLVPPDITWSVEDIQGRTRICDAIFEKFGRTTLVPVYKVRVVGIYGMGGVGKTTFCKVLCDELRQKFKGKVCHGELGVKSSFDLQKQVLRNLTDVDEGILNRSTNEDMTTNLLKRHIQEHQVFLALDNVWPETIEEARVFLRVGYHANSLVMVTARTIDILDKLNINRKDCLEMPELEEEDAKRLLLHHAACGIQFNSVNDKHRILECVRKCKFQKGVGRDEHFHPLALKVLGAQLGSLGLDPKIWVESLAQREEENWNQFEDYEQKIFSVLRIGYDSLAEEDKLLFMDSVLFHPPQRNNGVKVSIRSLRSGNSEELSKIDIYKWLRVVHLPYTTNIEKKLQGLKAKSIIEDIGDCFQGVIVHDLYRLFAKMEVNRGPMERRYWVWYNGGEAFPNDLVMTPSGNCWVNLKRVSLKRHYDNKCNGWSGSVQGIKWQHFSNIEVLHLDININEVLDLRGLRCLRSLEVKWRDFDNMSNGRGEGKLDGLGELRNLRWLLLNSIHYQQCFEEIGCLTALEVLELNANCNENCEREPLSPPNLELCIHLRYLILRRCGCMKAFPDLSKLKSLRKVFYRRCRSAREVVGLTSQMRALQILTVSECDSVCEIHGLGNLFSLQRLIVTTCPKLRHLPDLGKFNELQLLLIDGNFNQPLGFNGSMPLKELYVRGVENISNFNMLRNLQWLLIGNFSGSKLPDFGSLNALEELWLTNLPMLEELPKLDERSRLQRLFIKNAPKLHRLVVGDLVELQHLRLGCFGVSRKVAEVLDLYKLTNLQSLQLHGTPVKVLGSLKALGQLRELDCGATLLEELPDLSGLTLLERIDLRKCCELTNLGKLANLPALECLNVSQCQKLKRLPDVSSFEKLRKLNLCHSGVRLSSEDIRTLALSPGSRVRIGNHLKLNVSKMVEKKMSLTEVSGMSEVVMEIEAMQLEFFTKLDLKDWRIHVCNLLRSGISI